MVMKGADKVWVVAGESYVVYIIKCQHHDAHTEPLEPAATKQVYSKTRTYKLYAGGKKVMRSANRHQS